MTWWMLALIVAYAAAEVACASLLNPDPRGGGACHNGDQLATVCRDGSCCPDGYECDTDGHGCSPLPVGTVWLERRDAGGR